MTTKNLAEAAAEILASNLASKKSGGEQFGLGKSLSATPPGMSKVDLGGPSTKTTDANPVGSKGGPTATPPGATPPVSSEPIKKLKTQPQETEGRKDLTDTEEEESDSYEAIRDRIMGKRPEQTMQANPGAQVPHQEDAELEGETVEEAVGDTRKTSSGGTETETEKGRTHKAAKYGGGEDDEDDDEDTMKSKTRGTYKRRVKAEEVDTDLEEAVGDKKTTHTGGTETETEKGRVHKAKKYGGGEDESDDDEDTMKSSGRGTYKRRAKAEGMKEDIDAMLSGENLSEEFREKAATIFEAAVYARVDEIVEQKEAELVEQLEEAVAQLEEEMATKIDSYLNYVVEEWMEENQLAVERGLRAQVVEDFMAGLKNLFIEHYIDIPEEKVDLVEELTDQIEQLQGKLDEQIQKNIATKQELAESKIEGIIAKVCEGLTDTQSEKIVSLAEGVDYSTEDDFLRKMVVIRENYFPSTKVVVQTQQNLNEEIVIADEKQEKKLDPLMERYVQSIGKLSTNK